MVLQCVRVLRYIVAAYYSVCSVQWRVLSLLQRVVFCADISVNLASINRVAVCCCSVLLQRVVMRVAACCSVMQCAVCCLDTFAFNNSCVALCCGVLQCVGVCVVCACSVLQCITACCSA